MDIRACIRCLPFATVVTKPSPLLSELTIKLSLIVMLIASLLLQGAEQASADTVSCQRIKADIRRLQSRLRAAHSARQSALWSARLRELRRKRARACR